MSLAALRHQDHYKAATRELREAGYEWREEMGGKHAKIIIDVNGREETETISISPSDWRTTRTLTARMRRRIRAWKSEAGQFQTVTAPDLFQTLEVETIGDSIQDIVLHSHIDGEPRAHDIDLADRLGFSRPRDIRKLIERNIEEMRRFGVCAAVSQTSGDKGGRPAAEYWLNEEQALLVSTLSNTKRAADVRHMLIRVFVAWRRASSETATVLYGDDTQALLEMLADLRATIVSSQQNGHTTALEHIDGAKAAVLHYLKAYLKEPAAAFYEDVRTRNVATYERDRRLIAGMDSLEVAVTALLRRAEPIVRDRPFIWTEWFDCDRLYSEWFPERHIPRRGLLSGIVSRALDRHCKATRKFHHMEHRIVGGKGVNWWHKDSVFAWLEAGGRDLIEEHLKRYAPEIRCNVVSITRH